LRKLVERGELPPTPQEKVSAFLAALPDEFRFAVLVDLVPQWAALGAEPAMIEALKEVTGL
jgi:hypothetical protein